MVPKEWIQPIRNGFQQMRTQCVVFHARLPQQGMVKLYKGSIFVSMEASGGPWGLGALGPAILWGPLQGCDPTFHSWGVGAL